MKPGDKTIYRLVGSVAIAAGLLGLYRFIQYSENIALITFILFTYLGCWQWYRSLKPASDKAKGQRLNRETRRRLEEGLQADEKPKREE